MKKIIGIIVVFVAFSFIPVTNLISIEMNSEEEEFKINCRELAQGYYEFLVRREKIREKLVKKLGLCLHIVKLLNKSISK